MNYPFTKLFFKPKDKDIPEEKELLEKKDILEKKELPAEKEIPKELPEEKIFLKDLLEKKKVSFGYATKPEDRPDKPYQGWWHNQMEVAKNMYPDYSQDQLNQTVTDWWNKKTDKQKISAWWWHDTQLKRIKKSQEKLKGV